MCLTGFWSTFWCSTMSSCIDGGDRHWAFPVVLKFIPGRWVQICKTFSQTLLYNLNLNIINFQYYNFFTWPTTYICISTIGSPMGHDWHRIQQTLLHSQWQHHTKGSRSVICGFGSANQTKHILCVCSGLLCHLLAYLLHSGWYFRITSDILRKLSI